MSTFTATVPNGNQPTTAAQWQTWGQNLAAGFAGVGLVQTTDTGQVSWTTVGSGAAPGVSVLIGYEIYKFNDTLQATAPVFIRVEYRTTATTALGYLQISVGRGTNGAGTLTSGSVSIPAILSATADTAARSYLFVSDGSNLGVAAMWGATSNVAGVGSWLLSRTQDSGGAYNGDGYWWFGTNVASGGTTSQTFSYTANAYQGSSGNGFGFAALWPGSTSGTSGADLYLAPCVVNCAGKTEGQPKLAIGYYAADLTLGSTIVVNTHTYIALQTRWGTFFGINSTISHCALMLWE